MKHYIRENKNQAPHFQHGLHACNQSWVLLDEKWSQISEVEIY